MADNPLKIIEGFKGLRSNSARARVLHALVPELSPYECRDLRDVLNQEAYQKDFITCLPLELLPLILRHLDVSDLFMYRRVSRGWRQRLSSHYVCSDALDYFSSGRAGTFGSDNMDPAHRLLSKAQRHHALVTGRPYSKASFVCDIPYAPSGHVLKTFNVYCDYHSGNLVFVRSLASGRVFSISPRNRECIHQVKISDSLVAVVSSLGVCYVHDHHTEEGHTFRLPSIRNTHLSIAARRVAVAGITTEPGMVSLVLWDFDTQKASIVDVSKDTRLDAVLLHPHEDAFILFGGKQTPAVEAGRSSYPGTVDYVKYNFEGAIISAEELRMNDCWMQEPWHSGVYPSGVEGISTCYYKTQLISDGPRPNSRLLYEDRHVSYDMQSDMLLVDQSTGTVPAACRMSTFPEWPAREHQNVRWKDVVYMAGRYGCPREPIFVRKFNDMSSARETELSEIDHSVTSPRKHSTRFTRWDVDQEDTGFWILCDDRFFVLINYYKIQVWCFEKDLVMADDEPEYREERTRRAEIRAAKRRQDA